MNGVIETSTGILLRAGYVDFSIEDSFDADTETYITGVPHNNCIIRGQAGESDVSCWNGSAWVTTTQPDPITYITIDDETIYIKSVGGNKWSISIDNEGVLNTTEIT